MFCESPVTRPAPLQQQDIRRSQHRPGLQIGDQAGPDAAKAVKIKPQRLVGGAGPIRMTRRVEADRTPGQRLIAPGGPGMAWPSLGHPPPFRPLRFRLYARP